MKKEILTLFFAGCVLASCSEKTEARNDTTHVDSGDVRIKNNVDSLEMDHTTDTTRTDNSGNGGAGLAKPEAQ